MKKGTRYVVWLGFRISDDEIFNVLISRPSTLITLGLLKARKVLRKINIKKEF